MFNPLSLKFLLSCTSVLLLASFVAGLFSGCQNTESSMQLAISDTSSEKNVSSFTTSDQSSTGNERVVTPDQEMPADLQISGLHYLEWLSKDFDLTADLTDDLSLHILKHKNGEASWEEELDEKFQLLMEHLLNAKTVEEPEGIFFRVHLFYIGGIREFEEANTNFINWKKLRKSGDPVDPNVTKRIEQGRKLMNEVVAPAYHQAKEMVEKSD